MPAKHTPPPGPRESSGGAAAGVALLLPGMSMNATIFPALGLPTISLDFNDLVLGPEGDTPLLRAQRLDLYVRMLGDALRHDPQWRTAPRIAVGHSFGGMVALRWLLLAQGDDLARIHGLVLVATTAGPMFDRVRLRLGSAAARGIRVPLKPFLPLWNLRGVTRAVKRLVSGGQVGGRRVDFRRLARTSDFALDLAGWRNTDWRAMRSYRIALEGFDVRDDLGRITVPTIVLHGTRDTLFPVSVARELAQRLPNARLRVIRGAGHGLPLTHPEAVQRAVRELVRRET